MSADLLPYRFTPWRPARPTVSAWTSDEQHAFVAALERCGVVARAAASVGKNPRSAYLLRRRPGAEGFAAAWDRALDEGQARAIDAAMAELEPSPVPMYRAGRQVGVRVRSDNRVLLAALNALDRRAEAVSRRHDLGAFDPFGYFAALDAIGEQDGSNNVA